MTHPMIEEAARAILLRNGFTGAEIDTIQRINSKQWQSLYADTLIACRIANKACAGEAKEQVEYCDEMTGRAAKSSVTEEELRWFAGLNSASSIEARLRALSEQIGEA